VRGPTFGRCRASLRLLCSLCAVLAYRSTRLPPCTQLPESACSFQESYNRPMKCETCDDTGWVCEHHVNRPFNGPKACGCGGAGMPCIVCNGDGERPDVSRVFRSVVVVRGKRV